jgi:hypothetical protein
MTDIKSNINTRNKKHPPISTAPYLEIRNWEKFQTAARQGKSLPWCKLYSSQADDIEYQRLTAFQRGVLHDCYLVVTRTSHPLHNDITWLARTMHTLGTDRTHLQHAINTLISRGFLTSLESSNADLRGEESKSENEKKSESEKESEPEGSDFFKERPDKSPDSLAQIASSKSPDLYESLRQGISANRKAMYGGVA